MNNEKLIGYSGENIVKSNLILKGLIPFSSEIPSSTVDLIALQGDKSYRIQVKTSEFKKLDYIEVGNLSKYNRNDFDILAIVDIESNNVAYIEWEDIYLKTKIRIFKISNSSKNKLVFNKYLEFPY